jgi:hypothetical protein
MRSLTLGAVRRIVDGRRTVEEAVCFCIGFLPFTMTSTEFFCR